MKRSNKQGGILASASLDLATVSLRIISSIVLVVSMPISHLQSQLHYLTVVIIAAIGPTNNDQGRQQHIDMQSFLVKSFQAPYQRMKKIHRQLHKNNQRIRLALTKLARQFMHLRQNNFLSRHIINNCNTF
jgi:hypothetical protein